MSDFCIDKERVELYASKALAAVYCFEIEFDHLHPEE